MPSFYIMAIIVIIIFIYWFTEFHSHLYFERKMKIRYLRECATTYVGTLRTNYDKVPEEKKYFADAIIERYRPHIITENSFINAKIRNETSYLQNKRDSLKICLMQDKNKLHDDNILKYVLIHEITHMGSIEVGHDEEFANNFKWFLTFLTDAKVYVPYDFSKNPVKYCGKINVRENQYYTEIRAF